MTEKEITAMEPVSPVKDQLIWVRQSLDDDWETMYFSCFSKSGNCIAYFDGKTSKQTVLAGYWKYYSLTDPNN